MKVFTIGLSILVLVSARVYSAVPIRYESQVVTPSDPGLYDQFGVSVGMSGNRAIVGGWYSDGAAADTGAVYVYERPNTGAAFVEVAKIFDATGTPYAQFGFRSAIDGDVIAAGSPLHAASGGILVYQRDAGGDWPEVAELLASDRTFDDQLGSSVALSGNYLLAGAPQKSGIGMRSGAAYVFERDNAGVWSERAKMVASNTDAWDTFGAALDIDGNIAVVGAPRLANVISASNRQGSAYVFERDVAGNWLEQIELKPSDGSNFDAFGSAVAVSGNMIIVGAAGADSAGIFGTNRGAAYIFERSSSGWSETAKLEYDPDALYFGGGFGRAVDIQNGTAVVAGTSTHIDGKNRWALSTFQRSAIGDWTVDTHLSSQQNMWGGIGTGDLALDAGTLIVGDHFGGISNDAIGAAVVYNLVPEPSCASLLTCLGLLVAPHALRRHSRQ